MKRISFLLMTLGLISNNVYAQTRIIMQKEGGVYTVPCKVNGLPLKFIFDTGASNVTISLTEALFMFKNGYLNKDDIYGSSYAQLANGDFTENTEILLKVIEIADLKLKNVRASIVHELNAPLLLGQTAIEKLGKIQLDGNELIIYKNGYKSNYCSDITINCAGRSYNKGNTAFNDKDYTIAVEAYSEALDIAKQLGPEAANLQSKIEKQLTTSYLKQGLSIYKKKDYDGAVSVLEKGYEFAESVNDTKSANKFTSVIAQIRSKKGDVLRTDGKLDDAFAEYEQAIDMKPDCVKSFYGEGMVMKEKGDLDKMMEKMNKVVEFGGDNPKMAKIVAAAKANTARTLLAEAADKFNAQEFEEAGKYINLATNYAPFDEGTMEIFNQFADQVKDVPEMADAMKKAKENL